MKLNYKRTILVGFAFFLISAFWTAYEAIIPLILTNKFGMSQTWSGVIMAADNILAVFLLPIFGALSDKCRSRHGRRTPFIFIGTLLAALLLQGLSFADNMQLKNVSDVAAIDDPAGLHILYDTQGDKTLRTPEGKNYVLSKEYTEDEFVAIPSKVKVVKLADPLKILRKNDISLEYEDRDTLSLIDLLTAEDIASIEKAADREVVQKICDNRWIVKVLGEKGYVLFDSLSESEQKNMDEEQFKIIANPEYVNYVAPARQAYAAEATDKSPVALILFIALLLAVLISMAIFRSPAVALMPDVTVKPLRSKGNAIINLMGTAGGILSLVLGILFATSDVKNSMMSYTSFFCVVSGVMLIALGIFILTVREPQWAKQMQDDSIRYGVEEKEEETDSKKRKLTSGETRSLIFILLSVALWYFGYNAVTSKFSVYASNILQEDFNSTMLLAQGAAIVTYIPSGLIATKIGRKRTIMIGVVMLASAFGVAAFLRAGSPAWLMNALFILAGMAWATINVNSFPMVVEMCSGGDVGKYTGYYYTASMAAQTATPMISGFLMDKIRMTVLFPYATIFVALAFVTMFCVKHGDAKVVAKTGLEALDVD